MYHGDLDDIHFEPVGLSIGKPNGAGLHVPLTEACWRHSDCDSKLPGWPTHKLFYFLVKECGNLTYLLKYLFLTGLSDCPGSL